MGMVVTRVLMAGFPNQEAKAGQTTTDGLFGFENDLLGEREGADGLLKDPEGHTQIKESGAKHVAADAGGTV